ncbi:NifB/NifX family molybdenum-iron cluster-binding protein [Vallitalea okinawensis]|uniref:NifB/NifX family molybdenum-iron cluster-binding protein n=1 Tax=Vallitalea okinawensis TaxID=2078660 RepID=UPI000CFC771E|nr:NifB/NifX family molybdenum-iron cluster-binding protein [Vallitalea okinawensis]
MTIVAIAKERDTVASHFGHCEGFMLYYIEENSIVGNRYLKNPEHVPGFLPEFLKKNKVNIVIAGGMGSKAQELFKAHGIDVYVGVEGSLEEVINSYMSQSIISTESVCHEHAYKDQCSHHE